MNGAIALKKSKNYTDLAQLGLVSISVSGMNIILKRTDGSTATVVVPKPSDGISITNVSVNTSKELVITYSDGTTEIAGVIPTVKGNPGEKGDAGFSPTITENADNTDKIYKLDITTADSTFTTPNLKGADSQGGTGGSGEENKIDSISVNGVNVPVDENKNVDITVPDAYDDAALVQRISDIESDYIKANDISNLVEKEDGKGLSSNDYTTEEKDKLASLENYNDTQIKTQIQAVANGLMDSVGYSADYKSIDIIAKNGVKKSVNVAPIISHASITELSDVDTTNKATGKALVYNATTSKHEYADVSGTDEKVKMDASTDAKYLGELLDNITIANENGELKVKKLDGQEVTITEINYLKGLTMNVMDLVNMFSNGGVKIINTPVATYAELLTLDKSSFIEGISYLVYVLADENHDNAKTTYLVDKDSETPTYFGFADSQRDFTTNPIDLATEITGKLGIANMDSDAIKALFTVDDTYKTETATNNAFSTHGAKALYDELLLAIGNKANDSDLTAHKDDTDIHVSTEDRTNWDSAKIHADSAHAPSNAQENVLETVKVNGAALEVSNKAVNVTVPTTVAELTDSADYAKKTDLHSHENKTVLDGITEEKVTYWDNKSEFSGSYNDLNDKPTIDAELSNTSENAIQNKVVTKEINKLYSDISFNDFDTATDGISFTDAEDGNMLVTDWTKNLLNPTLETTTQNGVTCTRNVDANGKPDGTYTLNGTASSDTYFMFEDITKFENGKYKIVGFKNPTTLYYIFINTVRRLDESVEYTKLHEKYNPTAYLSNDVYKIIKMGIAITSGTTLTNEIIKPMLTTDLSATYDDFVPYGGYEIQSCGKNLFDNVEIKTNTMNIEAKLTDDAGIKLNGTTPYDPNWKDVYVECQATKLEKGKTYCLSVKDALDGLYIILRRRVYSTVFKELNLHDRFIIFTWDKDDEYIRYTLTVKSQQTFNNVTIYPQLEEVAPDATEPTDFEPYTGETITVTNDTESPAFGLKSHKGITNIISPGNVKCVYPTNESGKGVLDSLYNKDKMLTEQNKSLEVLGKCKNLFNPTLETTTIDGVTCTNNGDGTYTLNGTVDNAIEINKFFGRFILDKYDGSKLNCLGQPYTFSDIYLYFGFYDSNNRRLFELNPGARYDSNRTKDCSNVKYIDVGMYGRLNEGKELKNVILKPMITTNLSATYDDFVPYTGNGDTLTHDVAEVNESLEVLGKCKNLLNPTLQTTTQNGVTCTNNGGGTYTLNGTASDVSAFTFYSTLQSGKYKAVGCPSDGNLSTYTIQNKKTNNNGEILAEDSGNGAVFELSEETLVCSYIRIASGYSCDNLIFKPMLTTDLNATYDDFVPYTGEGETLTHDVAELENDLDKIKSSAIGDDWGKSWTYKVSSTTPKMFALHWSNSTVIFCVFYNKVIPFNQPFTGETYTATVSENILTVTTSETGILRTI